MKRSQEEWELAFDRLCRHFGVSTSHAPGVAVDKIIALNESSMKHWATAHDQLATRAKKAEAALQKLRESVRLALAEDAPTHAAAARSLTLANGRPAARRMPKE